MGKTNRLVIDAQIPDELIDGFGASPEYRRLVAQARSAIADYVNRREAEARNVAGRTRPCARPGCSKTAGEETGLCSAHAKDHTTNGHAR